MMVCVCSRSSSGRATAAAGGWRRALLDMAVDGERRPSDLNVVDSGGWPSSGGGGILAARFVLTRAGDGARNLGESTVSVEAVVGVADREFDEFRDVG